jgi:hypothetical protein
MFGLASRKAGNSGTNVTRPNEYGSTMRTRPDTDSLICRIAVSVSSSRRKMSTHRS